MGVKQLEWCWTKSLTDEFGDWLTPWSRVLSEKLTGPQPVKIFPAFYETRKFITVFKISRHLSPFLSQINPLPAYPSHFSKGQNHYSVQSSAHLNFVYLSELLFVLQQSTVLNYKGWNIRRLQEVVVVTRGLYTTAHCTETALGNVNQWYNAGATDLKLAWL